MKVEVCNIWHQKCCIEIAKNAEKICHNCQGHGAFITGASFRNGVYKINQCYVCQGEGKIDWITSIRKPFNRSMMTTKRKDSRIKCKANKGCKRMKRMWKEREHKSLGGYGPSHEFIRRRYR